ncbi:hypothetical protein CI238_01679 [Colletotrichum incanum]|uniref:Uncharacterized protein n=1 Tax=Colletotrichum incanum TaxID=1573173 RepID=A0A161X0H0_COLIC|nr:hypothetical protein CI238_01679 [Colletotrichum incanum]OHW92884.1 hypothetical protein CSPAE12_08507 [Colletotrichum incanum]
MCLRIYRHYTGCGCLLATSPSLRQCRHGPTSPLCGPNHTIGIVTRKGEECAYHARLTKHQRHAPEQSRKPRFRRPSGPGVTDKEIAAARLEHLRNLDMQERLSRFKAKGLEGSYRGGPAPKPRGDVMAFSRPFDGMEFKGCHPHETTGFEKGDVVRQKTRCRLRDDFLTIIQKEGLFDPSDHFLSSAWDDDDGFPSESSEADPEAMETTSYSEGAGPMAPSEAMEGGSEIMTGADNAMDVGKTDVNEADGQEHSNEQAENYDSGVKWTLTLKGLTKFRPSQGSA